MAGIPKKAKRRTRPAGGQGLGSIVATNLRLARQRRGLSQEKLAELVDIHRNYVGMVEREVHSPTVSMLEKLCRALEIDPQSLFKPRA